MTTHKWEFAPRFKRNGFGWKSDLPIRRIKEALVEIRKVAKVDPALGAEGAILLLEKLSPALEQVDGSSGAMGSTVNRAIESLVPVIVKPEVSADLRQRWMERLWKALQDDDIPYIEALGDHWGALCASKELASSWADQFLPTVAAIWSRREPGFAYFCGTGACLSAMYSAGRHEELLALLETARYKHWHDRRWGVKSLLAMGRKAQALSYAESMLSESQYQEPVALVCEDILLSSGLADVAYQRYAIRANQCTTNLATFRAIAKKYSQKTAVEILNDLIKSQPGSEGKWFAAAKDAELFDQAIELVRRSPTDPRTLTRAARDYAKKQPGFALNAGLLALGWIGAGHGYDITVIDVVDAYEALMQAATSAGVDAGQLKSQVSALIANATPAPAKVMQLALTRHLA